MRERMSSPVDSRPVRVPFGNACCTVHTRQPPQSSCRGVNARQLHRVELRAFQKRLDRPAHVAPLTCFGVVGITSSLAVLGV